MAVAGRAEHKTWWRNFGEPQPVHVTVRGVRMPGRAVLLPPGHPQREAAEAAYRRRFRRARLTALTPVVLITPASR